MKHEINVFLYQITSKCVMLYYRIIPCIEGNDMETIHQKKYDYYMQHENVCTYFVLFTVLYE